MRLFRPNELKPRIRLLEQTLPSTHITLARAIQTQHMEIGIPVRDTPVSEIS